MRQKYVCMFSILSISVDENGNGAFTGHKGAVCGGMSEYKTLQCGH